MLLDDVNNVSHCFLLCKESDISSYIRHYHVIIHVNCKILDRLYLILNKIQDHVVTRRCVCTDVALFTKASHECNGHARFSSNKQLTGNRNEYSTQKLQNFQLHPNYMYVSTLSVETKNIVKIADCFQLFILSELLFAASVHIYQFLL